MNKGRAGRGRGEDWCILGRQREDSRCSEYAGPAFIPISDNKAQFSFLGVTPPLSALSSSLGVDNPIPSVWRCHMTESGQSEHHIPLVGDCLRGGHIVRSCKSGPMRLNSIFWDHLDLKLIG